MNDLLTVSTTRIQQTLKMKEILDEGYSELFKLMVKGTGLQLAKSSEDI